jgi:hypothetical protein
MSTSKLDTSGIFESVTVQGNQTTLNLPPAAVRIRKNGIEFRSPTPIPLWTEMTVALQSPTDSRKLHCTGIVVASNGNRHTGYAVSMLFMNLSRQSQERLNLMAYSQLA